VSNQLAEQLDAWLAILPASRSNDCIGKPCPKLSIDPTVDDEGRGSDLPQLQVAIADCDYRDQLPRVRMTGREDVQALNT
jgi:hypothetical protein